jgi:hypothetical protein
MARGCWLTGGGGLRGERQARKVLRTGEKCHLLLRALYTCLQAPMFGLLGPSDSPHSSLSLTWCMSHLLPSTLQIHPCPQALCHLEASAFSLMGPDAPLSNPSHRPCWFGALNIYPFFLSTRYIPEHIPC